MRRMNYTFREMGDYVLIWKPFMLRDEGTEGCRLGVTHVI